MFFFKFFLICTKNFAHRSIPDCTACLHFIYTAMKHMGLLFNFTSQSISDCWGVLYEYSLMSTGLRLNKTFTSQFKTCILIGCIKQTHKKWVQPGEAILRSIYSSLNSSYLSLYPICSQDRTGHRGESNLAKLQTSRVLLIPDCTSNMHRMIIFILLS